MTYRTYLLSLGLVALAALAVQPGPFGVGPYRPTSDGGARIPTAWHLSGSNAFEPFPWPPFCKLSVGTVLKLHPNIFLTPSVLVCGAALLALLALSPFPDRLVLTAAGDPVRIGFYEAMRRAYVGRADVSGFLADRFDPGQGGTLKTSAEHHAGPVAVRDPAFLAAPDAGPLVTPARHFNDWTVYGVKPTKLPTQLLADATIKPAHPAHHAG